MQDPDLKLLSFNEDVARSLVRRERHFRAMDQPFDAGFDPCKSPVGHDTGDNGIMDRTHREIRRGALPGIGPQAL